jgi:hypothetical protein
MIHTQAFFIAGLDDPDLAKESAFGAMSMFFVTFLLSMAGICYDNTVKKSSTMDNDEMMTTTTAAEQGYVLTTGNPPEYGTTAPY